MKLYIMRHGHSPTAAEAGVASDFDRPLSEEGQAAVKRMAARLAAEGGKPTVILHSPLKRATQTARTVQANLPSKPQARDFEPLSNVLAPEPLFDAIKPELKRHGEVLVVGHQPQIGELAALLTGRIFEISPGGLIALDLSGPKAAVLWSANPSDLPVR
jgi:phosphohistidine phosphatase